MLSFPNPLEMEKNTGCMYLIIRFSPVLNGSKIVAGRTNRKDAERDAKRFCEDALACDVFYVCEVPEKSFTGALRNSWFGRGKQPIE